MPYARPEMSFAARVSAAFALVAWIPMVWLMLRSLRVMPRLPPAHEPGPERWPKISLLVPARNEGAQLEAALRSKLALDYPELEVVLINDRSTDDTGAIAQRLAAEHPRLKVVTIDALAPGWLGKVHALARGVEASTGEWLLFSDADIFYRPDMLRRAMHHCLDQRLDFLAALPRFLPRSFVLDAALADSLRLVLIATQADRIADPTSNAAIGAGIFGLVRRAAYDATAGFEWLRMEVGDDIAFGQMMKDSGARCGAVDASRSLSLTMYHSIGGLVHGVGKAANAPSGYRLVPHLVASSVALAIPAVPWVALALGLAAGDAWSAAAGAAAAALQLGSAIAGAVAYGMSPVPALFSPLAGLMVAGIIGVTGLRNQLRGSLSWRDTHYSFAELRAGQRIRAPWKGRN